MKRRSCQSRYAGFALPYDFKASLIRCGVVALLVLLCGGFACSSAQTTNATLSGTVIDPSGKVVPGVEVAVTDTDTGLSSNTHTNREGIYVLPGLMGGHYRIVVTHEGFKRIELTNVTLEVAASATRNFQLELGSVSQTVTVEGNALNINITDGAVSTVINREFVDEIPLNGRTLQNLLPLSPGIVSDQVAATNDGYSGYSVNGNRDTGSVYWTVDGISGNIGAATNPGNSLPDTLSGGLTILNTTQSLLSLDALQEFRISTSSYGVEYGVAPGAQVQLQSRSGTNQLHGTAYDYVRNTIFDANDWFADEEGLPKAPEQQNDFGATLGGPVWIPHLYDGRDKAFFFFSFEDLHLLQPQPVAEQPVPTTSFVQSAPVALQPYLRAFPAPSTNGEDFGNGWAGWNASFSLPSSVKVWSVRGDYALSKSTNLFVHVNDTPSRVGGLVDAYNATSVTNNTMTTVGVTTTPTPHLSNDLRFNFSRSYYAETTNLLPSTFGGTPGPAVAALTPPAQYTVGGGVYSDIVFEDDNLPGAAVLLLENEHSKLHQWNLVDGLKWQVGRHLLTFGGEWNRHTAIQAPVAYSQTIQFYELASVASSTADELDVGSQPYVTSTIDTRSALYVSDTWRANPRLSVDYGVRWELPFPTYFQGPYVPVYVNSIANLASPNVAQGRTEWNMTWRNFAPRLGVAYLVRNNGNFETVLRAGGGLFYSTEQPAGVGTVGYPDSAETTTYGVPFPVDPSLLVPPPTGVVTPDGLADNSLVGVDQNLAVPRVWEWNIAVEQGLGANQSLTMTYVGSAGRKLFFWPAIFPTSDNVAALNFTENDSRSNYNALQVKFDRHLTRGLQTLASYTWSHSIDNVSQDSFQYQPLWGNSDFDVRHAFSLALVYDIPGAEANHWLKAATSGWEIASNFQARTGLPVTGLFAPAQFLPNGEYAYVPAELTGQTVYLHGSEYPGGTALNRAAFEAPSAGTEGNVGRNEFRNQGFWQDDISLQRKLALGEKWGALRFRLDAFNVFNHPNFGGYFVRNLTSSSLFGKAVNMANFLGGSDAIYNPGGPRSLQLSLRYEF